MKDFQFRSSNMVQRLVEAPLDEGNLRALIAKGYTQVAPEVISCTKDGVGGVLLDRLDARPTGAAERTSATPTSSTLREDKLWMFKVVFIWDDLQDLLNMFEIKTRDSNGNVHQPIHAWPAFAELSQEKGAVTKLVQSLSEISKQYIAASLLIVEEQVRASGASSNREGSILAVNERKQKAGKPNGNQGASESAQWTKKALVTSVNKANLSDTLTRLGRTDISDKASYLQIAQALAKGQIQNSPTAGERANTQTSEQL